jgi:hypothetical protein
MDRRTQLAALATLAKAAAELAADVAALTSEAAGIGPSGAGNLILGTIMPAEQHVEELQAIFRAMHVLNRAQSV